MPQELQNSSSKPTAPLNTRIIAHCRFILHIRVLRDKHKNNVRGHTPDMQQKEVLMTEIRLREPDDDLLPLLRNADADELDNLVGYITKKGGTSCQLKHVKAYKTHFPDHTCYADEIAAEIQKFGGNTILNIMRNGKGRNYKGIACDVASRIKVDVNKEEPIDMIEQKILLKVLELSWDKMKDSERQAFFKGIIDETVPDEMPGNFPRTLLNTALIAGGAVVSYKLSLIVATAIANITLKRGIAVLGDMVLARWATIFTGAVGIGLTTIWTLFDVAGPAYRVTVPCVLHIAMIRQLHNIKKEQGKTLINSSSNNKGE